VENSSISGFNMKRFLLYVTGLCVATIILLLANEFLNRYLIFSSSNANPYKMYRLFIEQPKNEIAILGSSRAEAGFAPKELSDAAFNYGLSGSAMRETAFHLQAIVERDENSLVIVNLDPWGLGNGKFQGRYRFATASPLVKAEPKVGLTFLDRIPGVRFHGELRGNIAQCMNNRIAATKTMENGAILQRLSRNQAEWEYIISKSKPMGFARNQEAEDALKSVFEKNTRHEIVFVVSPVAEPWWERFTGKEELIELEHWLSKFQRVHVIDHMMLGAHYDLSEFMDLTHLNEHGARRFTRELKDKLTSMGLISNPHADVKSK